MSVCFVLDSTTKNDCHLPEEIRIHLTVNILTGHFFSYGDFFFFISGSYCCKRILTVKFKRLF